MKKLLITVMVCVLILGFTSAAQAVVITPGNSTTTIGASPLNLGAGTHVVTGYSQLVSYDSIVLTITQDVWLNSTGYLFLYDITRTDSTGNALGRFTTTDFTGFMTDVGAFTPGQLPDEIASSLLGDSIGFDFNSGLNPGVNSATMWIQTDAQYLTMGTGNFINGGVKSVPLYAPAVPEPASMLLLGMGILGLVGFKRKS